MVLLDSNAFLWLLYYPENVGPAAKSLLVKEYQIYVSVVSLWELAIKHSNGKLPYDPSQLANGLQALEAELLTLTNAHLEKLAAVELPQRDPFDRMLIAQSEAEGCLFMTADTQILTSNYHVYDVTK